MKELDYGLASKDYMNFTSAAKERRYRLLQWVVPLFDNDVKSQLNSNDVYHPIAHLQLPRYPPIILLLILHLIYIISPPNAPLNPTPWLCFFPSAYASWALITFPCLSQPPLLLPQYISDHSFPHSLLLPLLLRVHKPYDSRSYGAGPHQSSHRTVQHHGGLGLGLSLGLCLCLGLGLG